MSASDGPEVEARIVELRMEHPGWGPRTILALGRPGVVPVPGRSSIYRCLVRHGLIEVPSAPAPAGGLQTVGTVPAMELWQMDIVGRFFLAMAPSCTP